MGRLLLLLAILLFTPSWANAADVSESAYARVLRTGTLRCGYMVWPPHIVKDVNTGKLSGLSYDLIEAVAHTLNLKVEWSAEYSIGQQVEALKSGRADALCLDGPWTRSAMPYLTYTTPYWFTPNYIYMREGSVLASANYLKQLNTETRTFSALDGDSSLDLVQALLPQAHLLTLPGSAEPALILENVVTGKSDAVITDPITISHFNQGRPVKLQAAGDGSSVAVFPVFISLLPDETQLADMLSRAINFANETGQIRQIIQAYDPDMKQVWPPAHRY